MPLFVAIACGPEAPKEPTLIEPDDYAKASSDNACAALFDCGCPDVQWEGRAECREALDLRYRDEAMVAGQHGLSYDGECAADVIVRRLRLRCTDAVDETTPAEVAEAAACDRPCKAFVGAVGAGQPCARFGITVDLDDCAQGLTCNEGICVPLCDQTPLLPDGAQCMSGIEVLGACEPDAFCEPQSQRCTPAPRIGDPCESACVVGAWCDRAADPPTCAGVREEGEDCPIDEACRSGRCEDMVCTRPAAFACR